MTSKKEGTSEQVIKVGALFEYVLPMQHALDNEVAEKHGLDITSQEWYDNRIVALMGELYETMAVIESFKDWKINKGKIDPKRFIKEEVLDKDNIVITKATTEGYLIDTRDNIAYTLEECLYKTLTEECADVLHFLASLINHYAVRVSDINEVVISDKGKTPVQWFIDITSVISGFGYFDTYDTASYTPEINLLVSFIFNYFHSIGVNIHTLEEEYSLKHEVNYQRVDEGY